MMQDYLAVIKAEHIETLRYISTVAFVIFYPFISIILGYLILSFLFLLRGRGTNHFSSELTSSIIHTITKSKGLLFLAGLLPPLTASLVFIETGLMENKHLVNLSLLSHILLFISFMFLYLYRSTINFIRTKPAITLLSSIFSILTLLFSLYILSSVLSSVSNREKANLFLNAIDPLISWNAVVRYLRIIVLALSFAFSTFIVFFKYFYKSKTVDDPSLRNAIIYSSLVLLILIPPLSLWYIYTLPEPSLSPFIFLLSIILTIASSIIIWLLYSCLDGIKSKYKYSILILFILQFMFISGMEYIERETSHRENTMLLLSKAQVVKEGIRTEKKKVEMDEKATLEKGEKVFKTVCSACHSFTQRVVGPPLNAVIPSYRNKVDELKNFIKNPVKKDPSYPPMPNLGLPDDEIEAVSLYLLKEIGEKK